MANQNTFRPLDSSSNVDEEGSDEESSEEDLVPQPRRGARALKDGRRWESGMRTEIPEFQSNLLPEEFLDWLGVVEEILNFKNMPANARVVNFFDPITVFEAHQRALQVEKTVTRKGGGELLLGNSSVANPNQQPMTSSGLRCFSCGEVGHRQSECKKLEKKVQEYLVEDDVCPLLMVRPTFTTVSDIKEQVVNEGVEVPTKLQFDEKETRISKGVTIKQETTMVVRHVCLTPHADESDWLRNNVFHSTSHHASWSAFLQQFTFVLKHKAGASNLVADALSRRNNLLTTMTLFMPGFESFRDLLEFDPYFMGIMGDLGSKTNNDFLLVDRFLFRGNQLCIPDCSLCLQIIKELHKEGHVGHDRTLQLVKDNYFWPTIWLEVKRYVEHCRAIFTKDHFPVGEYNKLAARKIGPLEVLEKINPNAYRLKLSNHIRIADVFNVKHLMPYLA
ncbi:hypothetical protein JRO89_XS14G0154500 [Xanthoceras sorbifolium]|uniref:CCHC-type domain-containing protein n=1 Tax=Xanthoceras sorbifolium TaxID=99658 RepID=A0ABQ8H5E7_9ROSI|nr:hypothetical protein JRO89_XS14G0154500 [Xanthoceras sorbifolium]